MIIYNARIAYYMYINIKVQIFSGGGSSSDFFSRCGRWGGGGPMSISVNLLKKSYFLEREEGV